MAAITTTTSAAPARRAARPATGVRVSSIRDPAGEAAWAAYVHQSAEGTLFHLPLWCRAVERAFGHRAAHLMARRGTEVVGVLPLMEVRSWLAGKLLVSVPYATYGGLLYENEEARDALARAAVELVHRSGARALDLRSQRAAVPAFERDERYAGFAKQLPQSPDGLETFLPRKARAAARLAREREHLTVRHDPKHLRLVWRLYTRSMRRLASINYPLRFFTALAAELGPRAWVTTVWRGERPIAGLLEDLKRTGLLDRTLVVWGGEFGRSPMSEKKTGRDHNPHGFTMFLAGGGVRGGQIIGRTDELGLRAVEDKVHVHDLHATILYALGIDHRKLTFPRNGKDERATVDAGNVIERVFG